MNSLQMLTVRILRHSHADTLDLLRDIFVACLSLKEIGWTGVVRGQPEKHSHVMNREGDWRKQVRDAEFWKWAA